MKKYSDMERECARKLIAYTEGRVANLTNQEKRWLNREVEKIDKRIAKRKKWAKENGY